MWKTIKCTLLARDILQHIECQAECSFQEEEKMDKNWHVQNKQTNAREAHRLAPSSPSEVITMLKGINKREDKEHGKT